MPPSVGFALVVLVVLVGLTLGVPPLWLVLSVLVVVVAVAAERRRPPGA